MKFPGNTLKVVVVFCIVAFATQAHAEWGPPEIAVQGVLTNLADAPIEGPVDLEFAIYDGPAADVPVWTEEHDDVALTNGWFDVLLGVEDPLDAPPVFEQFDDLWVGVSVDGGQELPRAPLSAVGYAMQARHAEYCGELTGLEDCAAGEVLKRNLANTGWECAEDLGGTYVPGIGIQIDDDEVFIDQPILDGLYVNESQENAVSTAMVQDLGVTDAKISDVAWSKITGVPPDFADGVDNEGVLIESDPEVGDNIANYVPVWSGLDLIAGTIFDNGQIGIGTEQPMSLLQVAGGLVRVGDGGAANHADGNGDVYVQNNLEVDGEAWVQGELDVGSVTSGGVIDMTNHKIDALALPTADADAANKAYVDEQVAAVQMTSPEAGLYSVVMAMKSDQFCPPGYNVENINLINGPNGYLYININRSGLFMGGMNGLGQGQHRLYLRVPANNSIAKICWQTFTTTSGRPHASFLALQGGDANSCPEGYFYIPVAETTGNDNNTWFASNDAGMFLGYRNDWAIEAHNYQDYSGYIWRRWNSAEVNTLCMKIYGVDDDEEHPGGVYPVFTGLKNANACPSGWDVKSTSAADGNNGYFYLQTNDNATVFGGSSDWGHSGSVYMQVHFHYSHVGNVCWNFFGRTGQPFYQIRTPHQGTCGADYLSFEADTLKHLTNNNGYIAAHSASLYMGGIHSWGMHDHSEGYIQHSFTSEVNNKVCLKLQNVE